MVGLALAVLVLTLAARAARADNISLNIDVSARDAEVVVAVKNTGRDPARQVQVELELDGRVQHAPAVARLAPREATLQRFQVVLPQRPGTYPLYARVSYLNEGQKLSLVHVAPLDHERPSRLRVPLELPELRLRGATRVAVRHEAGYRLRLFLPSEIAVSEPARTDTGTEARLENRLPQFQSSYTYFAVLETPPGESVHATGIYRARVSTVRGHPPSLGWPLRPGPWFFGAVAAAGFAIAFTLYRRGTRRPEEQIPLARVALIRWSFSVFTSSLLFLGYHHLYVVPDWFFANFSAHSFPDGLLGRPSWRVLQTLAERLYFDGKDYDYFTSHVADWLYLYMLVGNYPVLRWVIKPDPATCKYWHLMRTFFAPLSSILDRKLCLFWSGRSKVAALTFLVKMFYVPLLCSWALNDIYHEGNLLRSFSLDFFVIQRFAVDTLVLIDVSIFAFGYIVELPQLKNAIRSVEPTLLGWVVCLMCYPPFNSFSYAPFDYGVLDSYDPIQGFWRRFALAMIAILWGIYTWASVALAARASNLTNRGIVCTGPYAYVRHPAYISKVSLWVIEAIVLANKNFFLVIALVVVYGLRAWTEERHLSGDPDFLAYRKQVRWWFIPYVI
ncbi:MAG: hypothetical protein HY744_21275 [Deltaproteobacteria bacterium]|nr:hypothetical protein [Deltaproteobacteria bacterium]